MATNAERLEAALLLALDDEDFMGDNSKVNKAIEALTPKNSTTATFKRLQGNARRDFLDKKDLGIDGYSDDNKESKIKEYVLARFKSYMENPKTSKKARNLYYAAYPSVSSDMHPEQQQAA